MHPTCEDGFIYAKGDIPVLLVAHMDTVFPEPPKELVYKEKQDKLYKSDFDLLMEEYFYHLR